LKSLHYNVVMTFRFNNNSNITKGTLIVKITKISLFDKIIVIKTLTQ